MYHQLKELLLVRVRGMSIGSRLPSVRSLIGTYGVSLPVVRQALAELERDGIIEIRKGSGSFVKEVPEEQGAPPRRVQFLFCGAGSGDPSLSPTMTSIPSQDMPPFAAPARRLQ